MEKERFIVYLPVELIEEVRRLKKETRIPHSGLCEEAIEDLIKKYKNKEEMVRDE